MKRVLPFLTLAMAAFASFGQEVIPADHLEKVVPRLIERAADQENLPLKVDGEAASAFGMSAKSYGAVLIPNKGLTAETFKKLGKEPVALGQLWLKDLAPSVDDKPVAADKLRLVKIVMKEEEHQLPLLLLAAQKQGDKMELLVYGKGREPLLRLALTKMDSKQEKPLELGLRKLSDDLGSVDVNILGQFSAGITVGLLVK